MEGSVGKALPELSFDEDMVEDDDVDGADVGEQVCDGLLGPFLLRLGRSAPKCHLELGECGS